ncbi:hypothetical protein SAMN05444401_1614 [Clostridium amylolyticum]|uniref:DUF2680 domain-containing protein n=1 Tax=Clostridium amylolyticum TaxID=1121298 RepID=A0A1M6EM49_9CLOT|nr:hypothetical protein [Clostridium amylolyticum]SHI86338.1 hypothetical protein SAMN05444401_1614 [Clostridium amylolyticum]
MKKGLLAALAITIALGAGATAYAATSSSAQPQRLELGRKISQRGWEIRNTILEKLGISQDEFTEGRTEGKSMYDLAKEKGITEDQIKSTMLEEKSKLIDKAVEEGKVTKEDAAKYKEDLKSNINSCDGSFGRERTGMGLNGQGNGNGQGMGKGQGMGRNGAGRGLGR